LVFSANQLVADRSAASGYGKRGSDFNETAPKTVTFDNFCAISLATALEHHTANQFLKAAINLKFV
jgi:hypothetical protein